MTLNGIILDKTVTDNINQMVTISKYRSYLKSAQLVHLISLITLTKDNNNPAHIKLCPPSNCFSPVLPSKTSQASVYVDNSDQAS